MKLVNTTDLKSVAFGLIGSSPIAGTTGEFKMEYATPFGWINNQWRFLSSLDKDNDLIPTENVLEFNQAFCEACQNDPVDTIGAYCNGWEL